MRKPDNREYHHHYRFGPGGMRCPCCNETPGRKSSMKDTKRFLNRKYRRKVRQQMQDAA